MQYFYKLLTYNKINIYLLNQITFQEDVKKKIKITLNSKKSTINILKYLLDPFFPMLMYNFSPALLIHNLHTTLCKLKVYNMMI